MPASTILAPASTTPGSTLTASGATTSVSWRPGLQGHPGTRRLTTDAHRPAWTRLRCAAPGAAACLLTVDFRISHRRAGPARVAPGPGRAGPRRRPPDAGPSPGSGGGRLPGRPRRPGRRARPAAGGPQRPRPGPDLGDGRWGGPGPPPSSGWPAHRPGHRRASAVHQRDPAPLGAPLAKGRRGAAPAVPARAVHRRLRSRAGRVLRVRRRAVGLDHWAAGRAVAGRACRLTRRDLSDRDYVYCWADGIHFTLRLADGRLCALVIVGVRADGTKELVAVTAGTRESTEDWESLLGDLRRRGMRAPVVMVGDGALGLWAALRQVFPHTREQRCWVHKVRNVLGALPRSVHPAARRALNEILAAEDRSHAERAIEAFAA